MMMMMAMVVAAMLLAVVALGAQVAAHAVELVSVAGYATDTAVAAAATVRPLESCDRGCTTADSLIRGAYAPGGGHLLVPAAHMAPNSGSSNANLVVSAAANAGHFAGSMVVEVAVYEPLLRGTDGASGEPHVSINGATLRMAQARDGYWYGYFANADAAQRADQIYQDAGAPGKGLDFGVFCGSGTPASVLGASFKDADGVAVPRSGGLTGFSDGALTMSACGGSVEDSSTILNNVVRSPPSINRGGGSGHDTGAGQIGLDPGAWPVVQLYSFSGNVRVQYDRGGGGPQAVLLQYGDIPSISYGTDRAGEPYPARAEVILSINDPQLNQDPTDEDSWTFAVTPGGPSVFYQAFYDGGRTAANGGPGLADLYPHLGRLGFDDNGYLEVDAGGVIRLRPNGNQPADSVYDGRGLVRSDIVTLVETGPNTGVFESVDSAAVSVMHVAPDAPRGTSATITYNDRSSSVLTGSHTASLSLPDAGGDDDANDDDDGTDPQRGGPRPFIAIDTSGWRSGLRIPIILYDQDPNVNPSARDSLDVYRTDAIIPTIRIGSPLTLQGASSVMFYPQDGSFDDGVAVPTRAPDKISARLHLDAINSRLDPEVSYGMISIGMGYAAPTLYAALVDDSLPSSAGTNWINYDLRALEMASGSTGLVRNAALYLYAGGLSDPDPVRISGSLGSARGMVQIGQDAIAELASKRGAVHAVIDFEDDGIRLPEQSLSRHYGGILPITIDIFSFGTEGKKSVNNAIYRLELEETAANSGAFAGTLEFAAANQLNIDDPDFARGISPSGDDVKFITVDRMIQEDGITITYYDLAGVGSVVPQSLSREETEIRPRSGTVSVSTPSGQLRFGVPVTVTLSDPDLNTSADTIEIYRTVDDPGLPSVDTVGRGQSILLEVRFKDVRYERCVVDGMHHGGLASTGFSLVETGRGTGVFEGVFKMPTWVCDKSGSNLMSTAGGSMDVIYYDARDSSGNPAKVSLLRSQQQQQPVGDRAGSPLAGGVPGSTGGISDDYGAQDGALGGGADTGVRDDGAPAAAGGLDAPAGLTREDNPAHERGVEDAAPEPFVRLDRNRVMLDHNGDSESILLTGSTGSRMPGAIVSVNVTYPDQSARSIDLRSGAHGQYGTVLELEGGRDLQGTYTVSVTHGDTPAGTVSFYTESDPLVLPDVFEDAVARWAAGDAWQPAGIGGALSVLAGMDVISLPASDAAAVTMVPQWLGRVAGWWSDGLVSDEALVECLQYAIDDGVLTVGGAGDVDGR